MTDRLHCRKYATACQASRGFRRRRWRSSSRGDKGGGGGLSHIGPNPAETHRRAPLVPTLPIARHYRTDNTQPVARHMARRFRSPGVCQAATIGLACVMLLSSPHAAVTQRRTGAIAGRLVDHESHSPIRGAHIALLGTLRGVASDSEGRFARDSLSAGNYVLQVRAIGYVGASWVVQLAEGEVHTDVFELERLPVLLDPVAVERRPSFAEERRRDFERRRAAGRGYFLTEEQIARAGPRTLGDLFRSVPGVRMQCRGSTAGCRLRMARAPRECSPDFVVDGFPATYSTSLDMPTIGIIGIEVYRTLSETPLDFLRIGNQCGTIVIWTRSGPG